MIESIRESSELRLLKTKYILWTAQDENSVADLRELGFEMTSKIS